jgi:hypothetical protein
MIKYNSLELIGYSDDPKKKIFKCDCGKIKSINYQNVKGGYVKSCGCLLKQILKNRNFVHGLASKTPLYYAWKQFKSRCNNTNNPRYKTYGGRGITYDPNWGKFENFYNDMIGTYKPGLTLDRRENDGNYNKDNCQWSNDKTQARNRTTTHWVEYDGKKISAAEFCENKNLNYRNTLLKINKGLSVQQIINDFENSGKT